MSDTKLVIAFDARIGNLERQLDKVQASMKKTNDAARQSQSSFGIFNTAINGVNASLGVLGGSFGRMAALFGVGFGLQAAISGFLSLADAVGNLGEQADQVGVSIAGLQAWQAMGVQFNVSADGMASALTRLTRNIGEAVEGNETAIANFNRLGVAFQIDGKARETEDVLNDIARAISQIESPAERASNAVNFFSRTGQQLLPLLVSIGEEQRNVVTSARDMGQVISDNASASFDKFGDSLAEFGGRIRTFIAEALAPLANAIGNVFSAMNQSLTLANQASRIRAGQGEAGDLERARALAVRDREAFTRVEEELARRSTGPGRGTDRELRPLRERVEGARRIVEASEAEVARIEGLAQTQRTQQEANASRERARITQEFMDQRLTAVQEAEAREAAARRGAAALRQHEQAVAARQEYQRAIDDAQRRGVVLDDAARAELRRRAEIIARGNAAQAPTGNNEAASRLRQNISESARELERLGTQAATPLQTMQQNFTDTAAAVATLQQNIGRLNEDQRTALGGATFENLTRNVEQNVQRTSKAMREAGASSEEVRQQIEASVTAYAQRLVDLGRLTTEQMDQMVQRARDAVHKTEEATSTFSRGFRSGLGLSDGNEQPEFEEVVGLGLGRETMTAFDNLFGLLEEVATGAKDAGDAMLEFAVDFVKAVAKIIAQAALLAAARAVINFAFGGGAGGMEIPGFGGPKMAGGPVAGGYTYLVGERGPELFTPNTGGRITANGAFNSGSQVIVNQNAPGVIVEETRPDNRTVMIAVTQARRQVMEDYRHSMRTGYGPYAEPINQAYQVRRRL